MEPPTAAEPHDLELHRLNRARLPLGWSIGAAVQLAFWALDLVVVPAQRWLFLGLRAGLIALGSAAVAVCVTTASLRVFRAGLHAATFLMAAVVTTMTFFMGGFGASYTYFVPAAIYAIAVLVAWPRADGFLFVGASVAYYLAGNGILLALGEGTWKEALGSSLFVVSSGLFAGLVIFFADRARRAERALRDELVAANRDLSSRTRELQESLRELVAREARLGSIGGMTSALVHDLRNPLSVVLSLSQGARDEARQRGLGELAGDLDMVVAACRRLKTMLEEVLAFARGPAGAVSPERVEMALLVEEGLRGLAATLRAGGVDLQLRLDACGAVPVLADRGAIGRALENLVRNAAESIGQRPGGGPDGEGGAAVRGTIRVEAVADGRVVAIRVVDDGPGIPAGLAGRLFEPFSTAGKPGGTGLGLAIARQVARAHGGDLVLEPTPPGGGAAFRLTVPRAPDA